MIGVAAEDQTLKVHRARDGSVWFLEGARTAVRSPLDIHDFPVGPEVSRSPRVRLLGTWDNAPLVARFCALKAEGRLSSVAVASPMLGRTRHERGNPQLMLDRMRAHHWPASLGGFHEATGIDYMAYLLATLCQFDEASPRVVAQILRGHALWRYLSFIPHLDMTNLGRLIGMILDPRWYARWDESADEYSPRDYAAAPKDSRRLNLFLGLYPPGPRVGKHPAHVDRAWTALATWKTTETPPSEALGDDPRYFLWRSWRTYDTVALADLRTTQLFVQYLRLCWLDVIYMASIVRGSAGRPDGLFAPDHFFHSDGAEAFRRHLDG